MINNEDFIKRLEILLDYYGLTASVFADRMGVQRSGLSHLMSGRNKPSLDFVMKITENFPEVDLYWLLNGTGAFPKSDSYEVEKTEPVILPAPVAQPVLENMPLDLFSTEEITPESIASEIQQDLFSEKQELDKKPEEKPIGRKIEMIVIFYSDGTFRNYNPEN